MIAIITTEQKDILVGKQFEIDSFFNPIEDVNLNFVISEIEYYFCFGLWYMDELQLELDFITTLELTEYQPKQQQDIL